MPSDYDIFATAYNTDNEKNAWNAYYERPAILALAGEVNGLDVLDAGCGGGAHSAALKEKGARVTGFDKSKQLLDIARQRLGPDVPLIEADLSKVLPLKSASFDVVLSALALHYLEDWATPLSEFARVLRPGGRLVFSVHHPSMDHVLSGHSNYFETYEFEDTWVKGGREMTFRFWHRPLAAMIDAIVDASFAIEQIVEPQPVPEAEKLFPEEFEILSTAPRFLFFSVRLP